MPTRLDRVHAYWRFHRILLLIAAIVVALSTVALGLTTRHRRVVSEARSKFAETPVLSPPLRVARVPQDGDCLYHAVAAATDKGAPSLRAALGDHLKVGTHRDRYLHRYGSDVLSDVARRVATPGAWGESEELEMLADMLDRCIAVHTRRPGGSVHHFVPGLGQWIHQSADMKLSEVCSGASPIHIVNTDNVHFDVLLRAT